MIAVYLALLAVMCLAGLSYLAIGGELGVRAYVPHSPPPSRPPPPGYTWVEVKATAYCPCPKCCGKHSDGRTSINRAVSEHPQGIAVEPKLVPYRTELVIPGYGPAMVDDTGVAMRNSAKRGVVHLDLRHAEHKQALRWGVRWLWVAMPADTPAAALQRAKNERMR